MIGAPVGRDKFPIAIGMTDGIHRPGNMMIEENTNCSSPEKSITCSTPVEMTAEIFNPAADHKGNHEAEKNPEENGIADEDHELVLKQWAGITRNIGLEIIENPTDMTMKEALHGAMRIIIIIGIGVMLNVRGRPFQRRPLKRHGAAD